MSEQFPSTVGNVRVPVRVTAAERTFWEKATILHQQAHKPGFVPARYSRHYYDLHMMYRTDIATRALADLDLLRQVVNFKTRFYSSTASRYDLAVPGTFRLVPDAAKLKDLERDYVAMQVMMFRDPPAWNEIVSELGRLEDQINESVG